MYNKEKILVANRGEIACRIMKTAKKMGIKTVAIYSEADANSLHVQLADEAILLGGSAASESYLNIEKIVNIAKNVGATYVHPGYGFLSENAQFAKRLEEEKINFIAPPVEAIKKMGDKIESKKIAKKAGVNVVPGYEGVIKDSNEAVKIAEKIGLPVMIKASAGGGGKGIRKVDNLEDVKEAFEIATNEAINSFNDGRVFIEKFIENPRHIEIQVIGDKFGNVVCLGERECSIQRNNQKIIEEAPSSFVDEKTRQKMYSQAVSLCKEVGYYSAGTIECMMDKNKNFYFLEMNTRLQVEHGVTELITGVDLVELMIRVARGEKLPFTQKDIELTGWAMESRICAEDPSRSFLPSSGRINKYMEPNNIDGVRIDTGVYEGYEISSFYDSMICKLLTYSNDRQSCIEKMQSALGSFFITGIAHNIGFLETITYNERFLKGDINTSFIRDEFSSGFNKNEIETKKKSVLLSVALYMYTNYQNRIRNITGGIVKNRRSSNNNEKIVVDIDGKKYLCNARLNNDGSFGVEYGTGYNLLKTAWQYGDSIFRSIINDKPVNVKILFTDYAGNYTFQYMGSIIYVTVRTPRISELEQFMPEVDKNKKMKQLKAPITGKIFKIKVKDGDKVTAGMELYSIEAMKMENIIRVDFEGVVKKVHKQNNDLVNTGDIIIDFE
ncbi:MAG: acetyl/propionyl/methylcrotonyl-CoA carboxylase subunit alpha [Rickettsiales bacterium]|nr:acetyl/propionyl/methylcrotonyl-CoA carboxylase subunit alpha [Rickettsiales bacterium]